jgi:hypothetical protein
MLVLHAHWQPPRADVLPPGVALAAAFASGEEQGTAEPGEGA